MAKYMTKSQELHLVVTADRKLVKKYKIIKNVTFKDLVLLNVPDVKRSPFYPINLICYVMEETNGLDY